MNTVKPRPAWARLTSAALVVAAILGSCGWSLAAPAAVILAVGLVGPLARALRPRPQRRPASAAWTGGHDSLRPLADNAVLADKSADLRG